ncbi:hypothetical protein ZIOFF_074297 (mitochondrion) [Zingiber officinale]|uniref:Photosystem II reaction center protein Z n=8 Tax=commelinids TaxID=4734 RepID=A0A8J5ET88_ZINOF|nr:hypothetical protein ZIOFF_074297 [Zingiber officinale]
MYVRTAIRLAASALLPASKVKRRNLKAVLLSLRIEQNLLPYDIGDQNQGMRVNLIEKASVLPFLQAFLRTEAEDHEMQHNKGRARRLREGRSESIRMETGRKGEREIFEPASKAASNNGSRCALASASHCRINNGSAGLDEQPSLERNSEKPCHLELAWLLTRQEQGIIDLHHDIFFFLILILVFVSRILVRAFLHFHEQTNPIPQRIVHGTTIEILRTIFPSIIPIFIAIPSFALLYSMDEVVVDPAITIKAIGHQWGVPSAVFCRVLFHVTSNMDDSHVAPSTRRDARTSNSRLRLGEGLNGIVNFLVAWRITNMTIAFQLAVFALIATSSVLLISVPVVFASSDGWSTRKQQVPLSLDPFCSIRGADGIRDDWQGVLRPGRFPFSVSRQLGLDSLRF